MFKDNQVIFINYFSVVTMKAKENTCQPRITY